MDIKYTVTIKRASDEQTKTDLFESRHDAAFFVATAYRMSSVMVANLKVDRDKSILDEASDVLYLRLTVDGELHSEIRAFPTV